MLILSLICALASPPAMLPLPVHIVTNHSSILWLERRQGKTLSKGFARHVLVNSAVPGIENMVSTGFGLIQFTDTRLRFGIV